MTRSALMNAARFRTVQTGLTNEPLISISETGSRCCRLGVETQITSVLSEFRHNRFERIQLATRSTQRVTRSVSARVSPGRQLPYNCESSKFGYKFWERMSSIKSAVNKLCLSHLLWVRRPICVCGGSREREEADESRTMNEIVEWLITKLYLYNSYY